MNEITVQINDPKEVQEKMSALGEAWQEVAMKSLYEPIQNVLMRKINRQTPRSKIPKGKKAADLKPRKDGYVPGQGNLQNAIRVPNVKNDSQDERSVAIGAPNVKYSGYVHEMDNEKTKWSTPGTGSHFIEGPTKELNDTLVAEICKSIDFQLKARGIL